MTAAPVQRVGLHELARLLDGDAACPVKECGRPVTHVAAFACCGVTADPGCERHVENGAEAARSELACVIAVFGFARCASCRTPINAASVAIRPI